MRHTMTGIPLRSRVANDPSGNTIARPICSTPLARWSQPRRTQPTCSRNRDAAPHWPDGAMNPWLGRGGACARRPKRASHFLARAIHNFGGGSWACTTTRTSQSLIARGERAPLGRLEWARTTPPRPGPVDHGAVPSCSWRAPSQRGLLACWFRGQAVTPGRSDGDPTR